MDKKFEGFITASAYYSTRLSPKAFMALIFTMIETHLQSLDTSLSVEEFLLMSSVALHHATNMSDDTEETEINPELKQILDELSANNEEDK